MAQQNPKAQSSITSWQWQSDALWQSCPASARKQADQWQTEISAHQTSLQQSAAQQPLTAIAHDSVALEFVRGQAAQLRSVSNQLIVMGTGGASHGAHALCALCPTLAPVHFLENCDPVTMDYFLQSPKETTGWCIVSKSGETVETLVSAMMLIERYKGAETLLRERVRVVTSNPDSTLGRLAVSQQWPILHHPENLGGRFSVFSIVGLLPAAYAGLNIEHIAQTGDAVLQQLLQQPDLEFWRHSTWIAANATEKPMHLLMAYADRLRPATQWFKQLWAESLGKNGKGQTPLTAIGAIDQHSQLQLYLDGPRDKLVTLWLPQSIAPQLNLPQLNIQGAEFLRNRTIGDVMHATSEATVTTMQNAGLPLRVLRGSLTPESLGQWMAWQMLETLAVAHLLGVDPYSQPAVEGGKKLTRAALAGA